MSELRVLWSHCKVSGIWPDWTTYPTAARMPTSAAVICSASCDWNESLLRVWGWHKLSSQCHWVDQKLSEQLWYLIFIISLTKPCFWVCLWWCLQKGLHEEIWAALSNGLWPWTKLPGKCELLILWAAWQLSIKQLTSYIWMFQLLKRILKN